MGHAVLRIDALPERAIEAAAVFYRHWSAKVRAILEEPQASLTIVMPPARYDHSDWRRSAVRDLARASAPARVNLIASADEDAIGSALTYLEKAPGVTGQYLPLSDGILPPG
ncbi:hypothetical protein GCM10011515_16420 [Tsuneonella deserti]|uniref:Short chain dehydrogenase-like proteobacteria domain-containing protein n=1 Tax=Tsuneonella deserti TaxID=2035528 RepID=A0ABQ1SAZ2_9SPHN|nr:hypothetical protein [Tsuneonella deserti]GGD97357.1 hypothetical protein GCM10011515_16420 [Tsuneonella deserti]